MAADTTVSSHARFLHGDDDDDGIIDEIEMSTVAA